MKPSTPKLRSSVSREKAYCGSMAKPSIYSEKVHSVSRADPSLVVINAKKDADMSNGSTWRLSFFCSDVPEQMQIQDSASPDINMYISLKMTRYGT